MLNFFSFFFTWTTSAARGGRGVRAFSTSSSFCGCGPSFFLREKKQNLQAKACVSEKTSFFFFFFFGSSFFLFFQGEDMEDFPFAKEKGGKEEGQEDESKESSRSKSSLLLLPVCPSSSASSAPLPPHAESPTRKDKEAENAKEEEEEKKRVLQLRQRLYLSSAFPDSNPHPQVHPSLSISCRYLHIHTNTCPSV